MVRFCCPDDLNYTFHEPRRRRQPNYACIMHRVRRTTRKEGSNTCVLFDRTVLVDDLSRTCGNIVHIAAEASKHAV